MKICEWHLCDNEVVGQRNKMYCGAKCKNKAAVTAYRRKIKIRAVDYMGGKCSECDYNRCVEALQFHHLDPTQKDFGISEIGTNRSWETIKTELDKCVCLCGNCHTEVHAGLRILS